MSDLFQLGNFTLNSGAKSGFKIECNGLADGDWAALAEMIRLLVGPFGSVEGVPRGGLKLAEHLRPHQTDGPHLIVDDVLTSGGSMVRARKEYRMRAAHTDCMTMDVIGAVVFARGSCSPVAANPTWIKAVFQMPEPFWLTNREDVPR